MADQSLVRRDRPAAELASLTERVTEKVDSFRVLDVFAEGGVAVEPPRVNVLATISAGTKNADGHPVVSRDGKIYLKEDGAVSVLLKRALAERDYKSLLITFPSDDPAEFIKCSFDKWTASRHEIWGNDEYLMVLTKDGYQKVPAGTRDYERLKAQCAVSSFVYFRLFEWAADGPQVVADAIGGLYRLRFTGRNSLRSLLSSLREIARTTGGRIAGFPISLSLVYGETSDRTGTRRKIPIWSFLLAPPRGIRVTSRNFAQLVGPALDEGRALALPPIPSRRFEEDDAEGPDVDLDQAVVEGRVVGDRNVRRLQGEVCDEGRWNRLWHAVVRGSELATDEGRHAWIRRYTNGLHASLPEFLEDATDREAEQMILAADDEIKRRIVARQEGGDVGQPIPPRSSVGNPRGYEELYPEDDEPTRSDAAESPGAGQETAFVDGGAVESQDGPANAHGEPQASAEQPSRGRPADPPRPDPTVKYSRKQWEGIYDGWLAVFRYWDGLSAREMPESGALSDAKLKSLTLTLIGQVEQIEEGVRLAEAEEEPSGDLKELPF